MKSITYLLTDLGCIIVPFLASFYSKHSFIKQWRCFIIPNTLVGIFFIVWDIIFTKLGVWSFNSDYLTGFYIFNLPIEEVLFFFCIPYACVFTYFAFDYLLKKETFQRYNSLISILLLVVSLSFMIIGHAQYYPFYTGLFSSLFIGYCLWKKIKLSRVFLAFLAIFPFFLISNNILTGYLIDNPIVVYNEVEFSSIRMWGIPIEDSLYGFLLIAMNIVGFEKRYHKKFSRVSIQKN